MKKIILVSMSILMLTGTIAAQSQHAEQKIQENVVDNNDHFVMENGTLLKPDGSYQLTNGEQLQLRNDQCIDMNGIKYRSERMFLRKTLGKQGMKMQGHNMQSGGNHQNMQRSSSSHH